MYCLNLGCRYKQTTLLYKDLLAIYLIIADRLIRYIEVNKKIKPTVRERPENITYDLNNLIQ